MGQQQRILATASYDMTAEPVEVPIGALLGNAVHLIGVDVHISNTTGGEVMLCGAGSEVGIPIAHGDTKVLVNHAAKDGLLYLLANSGAVTVTIYGEAR